MMFSFISVNKSKTIDGALDTKGIMQAEPGHVAGARLRATRCASAVQGLCTIGYLCWSFGPD